MTCVPAVLRGVSTGCKALDKALGGGLPLGGVSLVYGEAETGKTTLAMQCAVNCARLGYKTLFIDCDNTFSTKRLSQIASRDFENIAELIFLMKPRNFNEQALVVDNLTGYVMGRVSLIVVDTFTSLYRAEIAERPERTFELNRELNRQAAWLAQIAKTRKVAILLTSQVRSAFNEAHVSVEPLAPRVLKFWADAIIAMKPTSDSGTVKAVLEKGPRNMQRLVCYLKVADRGLMCEAR